MRRVIHDAVLSLGALLVLATLLVAVDGRLRERVAVHVSAGHATTDVAEAGSQVRELVGVVTDVVGDAMRLHTTLTMFVVIATVLTVFMVRT